MLMNRIPVDILIAIVEKGGTLRTGIDVYSDSGLLLLDRDMLVSDPEVLRKVKRNGVRKIPLSAGAASGIWEASGKAVPLAHGRPASAGPSRKPLSGSPPAVPEMDARLREIQDLKTAAEEKYQAAETCIQRVLDDIRRTGGEFDYREVERTVDNLTGFLGDSGNPFAYLTREIDAFDDYLIRHSIHVCAIGTAVVNQFNTWFSTRVNDQILSATDGPGRPETSDTAAENRGFKCWYPREVRDIAIGMFLHDVGKALVPSSILNSPGPLTPEELSLARRHSHDFGVRICRRNRIDNPFVVNTIRFHHAPLFDNEADSYPDHVPPWELPLYVRICKLADIFDAMASRSSYHEAFNQISAVTDIFRRYADQDTMLKLILHTFVMTIGTHPPGSILFLKNGQMACVLDSRGPIVVAFTDSRGRPLAGRPEPLDLGEAVKKDDGLAIDTGKRVRTLKEIQGLFPDYLKTGTLLENAPETFEPESNMK